MNVGEPAYDGSLNIHQRGVSCSTCLPVDNRWYTLPTGNEVRHEEIAARLQEFEEICRQKGTSGDHATACDPGSRFAAGRPSHGRPNLRGGAGSYPAAFPDNRISDVLDTLLELGVIRRVHLTGATGRFDGKIRRHHHLVCTALQQDHRHRGRQPRSTATAKAEAARVRGRRLLRSDFGNLCRLPEETEIIRTLNHLDRGLSLVAGVPMHFKIGG